MAPNGELIDQEDTWHALYNISTNGAVLVRPDGHVAWRSTSMVEDPKAELKKCLDAILG